MSSGAVQFALEKINQEHGLTASPTSTDGIIRVQRSDGQSFLVAVMGVRDEIIYPQHIHPFTSGAVKPQVIINIPSKTVWSGAAISYVHSMPAAFGKLGDVSRAAQLDDPRTHRNKEWSFFNTAFKQHKNVSSVICVYDKVFRVDLNNGKSLTIAIIEAYNMSAEDVRNAHDRFGPFNIALKSSQYGSITTSATDAAASLGAEALTFKETMGRLYR